MAPDIQHNDIQHDGTQNNNKNVKPSTMTLSIVIGSGVVLS
jgi:hypothetical protein